MLEFNNQVVIVTGAGSPKGIGRTIANTFARQGATVIVADINEAGIQDTCDFINGQGHSGKADGKVGNVTDKAAVDYASYSIMAARARYAYLLTIAKKNNIKF